MTYRGALRFDGCLYYTEDSSLLNNKLELRCRQRRTPRKRKLLVIHSLNLSILLS